MATERRIIPKEMPVAICAGRALVGRKITDLIVGDPDGLVTPDGDINAARLFDLIENGNRTMVEMRSVDGSRKIAADIGVTLLNADREFTFIAEMRVPGSDEVPVVPLVHGISTDVDQGLVMFDALTGLPSLDLFRDRLNMTLLKEDRYHYAANLGQKVAVFAIDASWLRALDDDMGEEASDHILGMLSARLSSSFRKVDTVARISRTKFYVLAEGCASLEDVEMLARNALGLMYEDLEYKNAPVKGKGCSLGYATYPENGENADDLISRAEEALETVLANGGNKYLAWGQQLPLVN